MARKKIDKRDIAIAVLAAIALTQAFFLFAHKPKVVRPKEKVVISKQVPAKPAVSVAAREMPQPFQGRIAIIIDDCGYNLQPCEFSEKIKSPVTFSVLPSLQHSTDVAECVHKNSKEVMLHLPLEPHHNDDVYPENYLIKTTMSSAKIESIIHKSLESVPYVDGINNHMGSKATENTKVMTVIFKELQKHDLFFIDSLVTSNSVCQTVAQSLDLSFGKRDIFLDNENNRPYIEHQFELVAQEARKKGYAIAIGHDRRLTLQIIEEQTDRLEKEGFKIIKVKDLLTHK